MRTLLFVLLMLGACWARAGVVVDVDSSGYLHVQAEFLSRAQPGLARLVLTDYAHLADFIPDMHSSRIVSTHPLQVEQHGTASFLMFSFPLRVVLEIEDQQDGRLQFHSVAGNLHDMRGSYHLDAAHEGTLLRYEAIFKPEFQVPPFIGAAIMRREIERQFGGLIKEMDHRQAMMNLETIDMAE